MARFASVLIDGAPHAVLLEGDVAVPLRGVAELGADTPSSVLAAPDLDRAAAVPVADVVFRPVVPAPGKVICVGLNYREHVAESLRDEPDYPVLFTKWAATLAGPYDALAVPHLVYGRRMLGVWSCDRFFPLGELPPGED